MEAILNTTNSYSALDWLTLLHENDPTDRFIVTGVSLLRPHTSWRVFQPEYVALEVQPHPNQPEPAGTPAVVKVSRDICSGSFLASLGIWSTTTDRVTILAEAPCQDQLVYRLAWAPDQAPQLEVISCIIASLHYDIPEYTVILRNSCSAFVWAILEAAYITFKRNRGQVHHDFPEFPLLSRHIVYFILPGLPPTMDVVLRILVHEKIFNREESDVERILQRPMGVQTGYNSKISWLSFLFPLGLQDVHHVTTVIAREYLRYREQ